jgi:hypothetical protein
MPRGIRFRSGDARRRGSETTMADRTADELDRVGGADELRPVSAE